MADVTITEAELLEALQQALREAKEHPGEDEQAAGALTVSELADELGWYPEKVRRRLKQLKAQGLLESIKVHREAIDGSSRVSPAYRFVGELG